MGPWPNWPQRWARDYEKLSNPIIPVGLLVVFWVRPEASGSWTLAKIAVCFRNESEDMRWQ